MTTVAEIRSVLEDAYPPKLAESWDAVGLICGDPASPVDTVAFALDCTQSVAEQAVASGAQMLVVHHPLLLRGVTSVAADTPKGKVIHTLITGGVALFAAHTNADSARPGVNDRLAELVGITSGSPILPRGGTNLDKWGVQVPPANAEALKSALFAAGAGQIDNYQDCSFEVSGTGEFTPVVGADPTIGQVGQHHSDVELRIEFVAPAAKRRSLITVLREVHPFEQPAFDIVELADTDSAENSYGLGRIGELPEAMTLREFTQQVADRLPVTCWGVRAAGDPESIVKKVAVSSGSGDSLLDAVRGLGVDVFVTSDLRHHPVDEYLRAGGPPVIDTAHWASEFPWTAQAAELVRERVGVDTEIIELRTDPWTLSAHSS